MRDAHDPQPSLATYIGEIGEVLCSLVDTAMEEPEVLQQLVDAETAHRLAPHTWKLYVETSCDEWLPAATNGSFAAWCGAYLAAASDDLAEPA